MMINKISYFVFMYGMILMSDSTLANTFIGKSLICSTEKFAVKGGFVFSDSKQVYKYNILLNNYDKEYVKKTLHCYSLARNTIAISQYSVDEGCGSFNSFLDSKSLKYTRPLTEYVLTANCDFYERDLEKKLNEVLK